MTIFLGILAVLEAVLIAFLIFRIISEKKQTALVLSHAEEIKRRKIDIEDMELSSSDKAQSDMADAINVIKNNLQTFLEAT